METYKQFLDRINSFEKAPVDFGSVYFTGSPSIANKVNADNTYKDFYGDTVVFDLDEVTKTKLTEYADFLHKAAPQCFCDRLVPNTFHVTLHDLSNSPTLQSVAEELFFNELKITEKLCEIKKLSNKKITLKSNAVFNMVNTSLVLGLYPVDEDNYNRLMELYYVIDSVKRLSYPLTPHITLGYYNVNGFDTNCAKLLKTAVEKLNAVMNLDVSVGDLYYQKFTSMNNYVNIIKLNSK